MKTNVIQAFISICILFFQLTNDGSHELDCGWDEDKDNEENHDPVLSLEVLLLSTSWLVFCDNGRINIRKFLKVVTWTSEWNLYWVHDRIRCFRGANL